MDPIPIVKTGVMGEGEYGKVYSARSLTVPPLQLAVKRNFIDIETDFTGSIKELDLLTYLKDHPHLVQLVSVSMTNPFSGAMSPIRGSNAKSCLLYTSPSPRD